MQMSTEEIKKHFRTEIAHLWNIFCDRNKHSAHLPFVGSLEPPKPGGHPLQNV